MFGGDKLISKVPLNWRKGFSYGVIIPHKMRNCNKCKKEILYDDCDKLVNRNKEFSSNLNELKQQPPSEVGHMLPKYIIT